MTVAVLLNSFLPLFWSQAWTAQRQTGVGKEPGNQHGPVATAHILLYKTHKLSKTWIILLVTIPSLQTHEQAEGTLNVTLSNSVIHCSVHTWWPVAFNVWQYRLCCQSQSANFLLSVVPPNCTEHWQQAYEQMELLYFNLIGLLAQLWLKMWPWGMTVNPGYMYLEAKNG